MAQRGEGLDQTWPLFEQGRHFDLGHILNSAIADAIEPAGVGALGIHHAGLWECDLSDDRLVWSGGVFDLFGVARGSAVSRELALGFYREECRAKLERLRAHAIRHRLGFTLDVEILPAAGAKRRRMRLIGAPRCEDDRTTHLHGLKLLI